jgi:hypothetical protein
MLKFVLIFLVLPFIFADFPAKMGSSSRRDRSDLVGDLEKFRDQQRKFLDQNSRFNASGFLRGGKGFPNSNFTFPTNSSDLEDRINQLRSSIPQGLRFKCYETEDLCVSEGNCADKSNCVFCMNFNTRKTGYRCLNAGGPGANDVRTP